MAYNPDVSFFIPFHELNPSEQRQCISPAPTKGRRCGNICQKSDNGRAIALHKTIIATSTPVVSLDLLQEYALCNCCRVHHHRIEDNGLLMPLARRWQDEIRKHAADQSDRPIPIPDHPIMNEGRKISLILDRLKHSGTDYGAKVMSKLGKATVLDSGYGFMSNTASKSIEQDDDKSLIWSFLPNALRFSPQEEEHLIAVFAGHLCQDIDLRGDHDDTHDRISARLPDLLKTFTLRLEESINSEVERKAKELVWQQRE
jgi:hypothetical protein